MLICGVYVDLNQIRADEAATPEQSRRTSAYRRIMGRLSRSQGHEQDWDSFLCPIDSRKRHTEEDGPTPGQFGSTRASDTGLFEMALDDYLEILDWTGRQIRPGKKGAIDQDSPPILERISLVAEELVAFIQEYDSLFPMAVGTAKTVTELEDKVRNGR